MISCNHNALIDIIVNLRLTFVEYDFSILREGKYKQ